MSRIMLQQNFTAHKELLRLAATTDFYVSSSQRNVPLKNKNVIRNLKNNRTLDVGSVTPELF
jgi:hypothetical protein